MTRDKTDEADQRWAAIAPIVAKINREMDGAPSFMLGDGEFYKAVPVALADQLAALMIQFDGESSQ